MDFSKFCFFLLLALCLIFKFCESLECYVCTNQEENEGKCLNTIKTCEQEEDMCLSEVFWGTPPYWSQGSKKQYYISKRCATKEICRKTRNKYLPLCTYIQYQDWKCSECCSGNRCNYFMTLSGSLVQPSAIVMMISISAVFIHRLLC